MGDVVAARAASRADAWRHIEPLVVEAERLRKENARLTDRNIALEALGAAAEQTHDEWELLQSVVAGVEALAEGKEAIFARHWLTFDARHDVAGCHCGFRAEMGDEGHGDSVIRHLEWVARRRLRSVLSDTKGDAQ